MQNKEVGALVGIDKTFEDQYENDAWYVASGAGGLGWTKLAFATAQRFFRIAAGRPQTAEALLPTDEQVIEFGHSAYEATPHTRISKSGKTFLVNLPVGSFNLDLNQIMRSNEQYDVDWKDMATRLETKIPGILDPDTGIDMQLPLTLLNMPFTSADYGFEDDDALDLVKAAIKGIRFNAAPNRKKFDQQVTPAIVEAWATQNPDRYEAQRYVKALMESRQAVLYFRVEVSNDAARHICQGEPSLGLLGEYFGRMLQWMFGEDREYVHNLVPISKIAASNDQADIKPVSRTDENGLAVDSRGNVVWLPTFDNAEFVEAEIEAGGIQPDGDWTRLDAIDPEKNEYMMAPGVGGRNVRMRKPKGRNRLVYTDWHNSRLSYTDDSGRLQLMDLSMYRKANAGQLAKILNSSVTAGARTEASNLQFAVERGAQTFGIRVAYDATHFDGYFDENEAKALLERLNGGHLGDYLHGCQTRMQRIKSSGEGSRRWNAEELNRFDTLFEQWLTLDLISVTSPLTLIRPVAEMLVKTFDHVMQDPAAVFGRYAVTTTLKEMATLLVIARYAGKYAELKNLDDAQRAKYLAPDLSPINEVEVTDVPFVSGSVELFPHQVKAWNYLKNGPENAILDVAAGGGKTLLALLDIAYHIGKGMLRPLVICPGDLIRNYINDAQWLFKGKMNMVVLNGTTFASKEWGEEKLRDLANHAPPNTIFLTDYDFIIPKAGSKRMVTATYGTEQIRISLNNEFLKSIAWGGIWMDESHLAKTTGSSTNRELQRLVSTIPFKRQLSGTYISDNLTDVVGEFSLIDPQTFGDMEQFEDDYYTEGRRSAPLPGAQRRIYAAMAQNANVITIRRKEWAAILPRRSDTFHPVYMTPNQKMVYERILAAQKAKLLEQTATDAELKALLNGGRDEDGNAVNVDELLDGQLGFVFQRLEQFVTAPSSDELGSMLTGADRRSPKIAKVEDIIRRHIADRIPGKILVWTQYVESSANLFKMLSPEIQAMCVHYKAGNAEQAMAEFESNPNKLVMVGCEKSMNTGHNLQYCSRIIRLETVWNWGTLEQGESRINRPKTDDPRRHENGGQGIHYDWVFCDESIDVTKNSRMISKLISTIKFYERDNQAYQELGIDEDGAELRPISLTQENIFAVNKWNDPDPMKGCLTYFNAYQQYQVLEQEEFDKFVNDPENRIEPYTLEEGHIVEGSALLKRIPYVPQMKVYDQERLGLIPFVDYISTEYSDKKKTVLLAEDPQWDPIGLKLHTEYGDCVCKGYNKGKKSLRVTTPDGSTASTPITMAWVITKDVASGQDIRQAIGRRVGVVVDEDKVVTPTRIKQLKEVPEAIKQLSPKSPKRAPQDDEVAGAFEINLDTYNEYLSLVVSSDDPDVAANIKDLEQHGFITMPHYHYSRVRNFKTLDAWIAKVQTKATIHPRFLQELEEQSAQWRRGKTLDKFAQGLAAGSKRRFLTEEKIPAPKGTIRPYLVTHNHEVFLCMNLKVNALTFPKVKTVAVPGVAWKVAAGEHWFFARSKQEVQTVLKKLFAKYNITNRADLVQELAQARIVKVS